MTNLERKKLFRDIEYLEMKGKRNNNRLITSEWKRTGLLKKNTRDINEIKNTLTNQNWSH